MPAVSSVRRCIVVHGTTYTGAVCLHMSLPTPCLHDRVFKSPPSSQYTFTVHNEGRWAANCGAYYIQNAKPVSVARCYLLDVGTCVSPAGDAEHVVVDT